MTIRRPNDIGGRDYGPVPTEAADRMIWERLVDAVRTALGDDICSVDEMRRGMEDLGSERYEQSAFFERRLDAILTILEEKGLLARSEVEARARALMETGPL